MRSLVWRYVAAMHRKFENNPVSEDDINEVKSEINTMRYEMLEIFENSGMDVSSANKKDKRKYFSPKNIRFFSENQLSTRTKTSTHQGLGATANEGLPGGAGSVQLRERCLRKCQRPGRYEGDQGGVHTLKAGQGDRQREIPASGQNCSPAIHSPQMECGLESRPGLSDRTMHSKREEEPAESGQSH